ncbi:MAG: hypothetical protein KGH76_05180, partial [Thaumarchaeota archaeon]|nr:hypothetical protein [Nitrososphaerota archaeon]
SGSSFVSGASYLIIPNPSTGKGSVTVTDTANNGIIKIVSALYGTYNVTQTTTPSSYSVLVPSNFVTVSSDHNNATNTFTMISTSTNISQLSATKSESPDLNSTTLDTWKNTYQVKIINGSQTGTLSTVHELPSLIVARSQNTNAINSAISSQSSISLATTLSQLTSGTAVMDTLKVPNYTMPTSSSLTVVLPSFVASGSSSNSQFVTTPSIPKITPGQQFILPVQSNSILSTGGLKQMNITPSSSVSSTGNAKSEWFVVESNNQVPSSITQLSSSGITGDTALFVQVKYPYEDTNTGINWNNPSNFATSPILDVYVSKSLGSVQKDANGCPVVTVYTLVGSTWTSSGITVLSTTSVDSSQCDIKFQTPHFSSFSVVASTSSGGTSSGTSSSGTGTSSSGASSGTGGGGTGVGFGVGTYGTSSNGTAAPYLKIEKISYDTCYKQIATIQVATDASDVDPMVIVRTSVTGVVSAKLTTDQPFAQENTNSTIRHLVYQASLSPKETSFEVVALESVNHNIFSVGKTVNVNGCGENLDYTQTEPSASPVPVDLSAPKIFDIRVQIGNGTKQPADSTQFVDNKPLVVYAIVDTPTQITSSELRFADISDSSGQYNGITMDVVPLQISNSTYLLSGIINSDQLKTPAIKYWIHVENNANKKMDSDTYTIGVKPAYPILGDIDLDAKAARMEGTIGHPTAYFSNNSTGPVYGNIELAVNGTIVYTSPSQIFSVGQTTIPLQWKAITVGKVSTYQLQARAEIFGKEIVDTTPSHVSTFPGTDNIYLSHMTSVNDVSLYNVTIARASVLYSSFVNDGTMRYKVTSPDGTCVIGPSDGCLVSSSTLGNSGGIKSITLGDQVYRVRYTGSDDTLERFSITSADSLAGNWKVEIDSTDTMIPIAHAMDNVILKVKYRAVDTPFITEKP